MVKITLKVILLFLLSLWNFAYSPSTVFLIYQSQKEISLLDKVTFPHKCVTIYEFISNSTRLEFPHKTGKEKLPHVFLNQPSTKTQSELQIPSFPVTVSNKDKFLLFQRLTQISCVPLLLSPQVSSHRNNKK